MACCGGCEGGASCGDRCDRFLPCISQYPSTCGAFLTVIAAAVVAAVFGLYSYISLRTSIFRFPWSTTWLVIVNSALLALILAVLLLPLALALWFVFSSPTRATIYKVAYLVGTGLVVVGLAAVMVACILVLIGASRKDSAFSRELEKVWVDEVAKETTLPCQVQKRLICRGFEDGDCLKDSETRNFSRCGKVCRQQDVEGQAEFGIVMYPGCRDKIMSYYRLWNAVLLGGATVACLLVLVSFFVVCSCVSFESEK